MKAVISNRIYLGKPKEGFDSIKQALTYKLEQKYGSQGSVKKHIEIIRNYTSFPRDVLSIPQGRLDLIPEDYEIVDKRVTNSMPFPTPRLQLRDDQKLVFDELEDTCFINALPGWGKTFIALYAAMKLGQKTLIITHNTFLRDQWISEVEKLFGMQAGIIGSSSYDIDHVIVVANIQTFTKYAQELSKEFGTVIMDEAHHCPASTFTTAIDIMHARYRIGLSGTMKRKDGKHIMFADYFGNKVFVPPQNNTVNPTVKLLRTGVSLTPGAVWAKKINNLLYDPDYQEYVAIIAKTQAAMGHKVLVVADRTEFLQNIKDIIGEKCVLAIGETSLEERNGIESKLESGKASIVAGSRQIFSEGISVNILSCLILATPISNEALLEQLAGRIMRRHPNKLDPIIIDLQFSGPADKKQNNVRLGLYMDKGWEVVSI